MILSDEDVKALKLEVYGPYKCAVEVDALRTVLVRMTEAAVLEKLRQQEPVEFWLCKSCGHYYNGPVTSCDCMANGAPKMVHLYAAPVPTTTPKE